MSAYDYYKFYLKAEDLMGKSHMVKVCKAYPKKFFTETRLVIEFEGKRKALKLNETQAEAMMDITGTEHERQWIGAEVTLTPAKLFNGKQTIKVTGKTHVLKAGLDTPAATRPAKNAPVEVGQ
jgi:hypothetical protein